MFEVLGSGPDKKVGGTRKDIKVRALTERPGLVTQPCHPSVLGCTGRHGLRNKTKQNLSFSTVWWTPPERFRWLVIKISSPQHGRGCGVGYVQSARTYSFLKSPTGVGLAAVGLSFQHF